MTDDDLKVLNRVGLVATNGCATISLEFLTAMFEAAREQGRQEAPALAEFRANVLDYLNHQIDHGYAPDGLPQIMNSLYAKGRLDAFSAVKSLLGSTRDV